MRAMSRIQVHSLFERAKTFCAVDYTATIIAFCGLSSLLLTALLTIQR
jgi:hypothetical protein